MATRTAHLLPPKRLVAACQAYQGIGIGCQDRATRTFVHEHVEVLVTAVHDRLSHIEVEAWSFVPLSDWMPRPAFDGPAIHERWDEHLQDRGDHTGHIVNLRGHPVVMAECRYFTGEIPAREAA